MNTMSQQYASRQIVEALRTGIVPPHHIENFVVGLKLERLALERALDRAAERGGDSVAVQAEYGGGKTFFTELAALDARTKGFLVAKVSLDLRETPPNRPYFIYRDLIASLTYPDTDATGLNYLLDKAMADNAAKDYIIHHAPLSHCPLKATLYALTQCQDPYLRSQIVDWLSGQTKKRDALRLYVKSLQQLYYGGEVSVQFTYLLSAISTLSKQLGYAGLAVLIDETERYEMLTPGSKERAVNFFKAMIRSTLRFEPETDPNSLPSSLNHLEQHPKVHYQPSFAEDAGLFFLFTYFRESENSLPVDAWLSSDQIIRLSNKFLKSDVLGYLRNALDHHAIAYGYSCDTDIYKQALNLLAETLPRRLEIGALNPRGLIRLVIEIFDRLYLVTDYGISQIRETLESVKP